MTSSAKQNCKNKPSSLADGADLKGIKEGYNNYSNRYVINPEEEISNLKYMIRDYNAKIAELEVLDNKYRDNYIKYDDSVPSQYANRTVALKFNTSVVLKGYVTRYGKFKPLPTPYVNSSSCPSDANPVEVVIQKYTSGDKPEDIFKNNPTLPFLLSSPMVSGQPCDKDGMNVEVRPSPIPSHELLGCYSRPDPKMDASMVIQPGGKIFTVASCKRRAVDNNASAFALTDYTTSGGAGVGNCYTGSLIQTDPPLDLFNETTLWETKTAGNPGAYMELKYGGFIRVYKDATKLIAELPNTGDATCNIQPEIISATWGGVADTNNILDLVKAANVNKDQTFSFSIGTPTPAIAPKNVDANGNAPINIVYKCGTATKSANIREGPEATMRSTSITITCPAEATSNCDKSYILLKDGGIIEIWKGKTSPTDTAGTQIKTFSQTFDVSKSDANKAFPVASGKSGDNYLSSVTKLLQKEYISSKDGKLVLMMGADGNLVLKTFSKKTKCASEGLNRRGTEFVYGLTDSYSLYKFSSPMDNSKVGKLAYIDDDGIKHEYPSNMVTYSDMGDVFFHYDYSGDNVANMPLLNKTLDECATASKKDKTSGGYVYDNNAKECWIKNSNLNYASSGKKTYSQNKHLYLKRNEPIPPSTCTSNVSQIYSSEWDKYKSGELLTTSFACGAAKAYSPDKQILASKEKEVSSLANDILDKIYALERSNVALSADIKKFKQQLLTSKDWRKNTEEHDKNKLINIALGGMLSDTDITLLQQNTRYLFFSIFAVGALVATLHGLKR
jgi:hypothetical protein